MNKSTVFGKFLCQIGFLHSFEEEGEKVFCKYCKKIPDKWDSFLWFDL